jgi:gamma-glutamyltranspeptidase/glutathione hydrolase
MTAKVLLVFSLSLVLGLSLALPVLASAGVRPVIMGTNGMVACGHYLAAHAGNSILLKGGNAFDAGAAMLLCQSLLEQTSYGFGGETPMIFYAAREQKVYTIDGNCAAPKSVDVAWFQQNGLPKIPGDGLLPAGVPGVCDAIVTLLDRFGTMSFTEVAADAIRLAEEGFPLHEGYINAIRRIAERCKTDWPTSRALFMPNGEIPKVGTVFRNPDMANTWKKLCEAEQAALKAGRSRNEALQAVRDRFYKGDIAEALVRFQRENAFPDDLGEKHYGNLTMEDFATYRAKVREPVHITYKGYDVYKCDAWTQGPVFLIHLKLLEQFDLKKLGYGTADYWHVVVETMKLAHADKIKWFGDPDFIDVPLKGLLSDEYAKERAKLVDMKKAISDDCWGDPWKYEGRPKPATYPYKPGTYLPKVEVKAARADTLGNSFVWDTTGTRAADRWGNLFSCTPSGGWFTSSPIVPGLGFVLGTRIQMFYVDRTDHAKSYVPGARPSTSLTPTLVLKDGKPFMALGMPGGDEQDQVTLQDFLHVVEFGKNIQEATELPHVTTANMPSLFYPHGRTPGRIGLPATVAPEVVKELEARGHKVTQSKNRFNSNSTIIVIDPVTNVLYGAAAPADNSDNRPRYAIGW